MNLRLAQTFCVRCVALAVGLMSGCLGQSTAAETQPSALTNASHIERRPPGSEPTSSDRSNSREVPAAAPVLETVGSNAVVTPLINSAVVSSRNLIPHSTLAPLQQPSKTNRFASLLEEAAREKQAHNFAVAEKIFIRLLEGQPPPDLQKTALIELAVMAQEKEELPKAQQIYAQFVSRFPQDDTVPEVLLRQGVLYRQMGAPTMALSKFYAVMSTALNLRLERLEYYQRLVLNAQAEIADTYYLHGKYEEAVDFFGRLLKLDNPGLDRSRILHKMVRSLSFRGRHVEVAAQAESFLDRYPEANEAAEIRFFRADALKKLGRKEEAMGQVLALLKSQQKSASQDPQNWNYWRQRAGNEIANQFYEEGDYMNALQIYLAIAALNSSPDWEIPALYQVGLVYERLRQPQKALETYDRILKQPAGPGSQPASASLAAILDMAKWRKEFLGWHQRADLSNAQFQPAATPQSPAL